MVCPVLGVPTLQIMLIGQLLMLELLGQSRHFGEHFNNDFPVDFIDSPLFANKVHFSHPTIDGHPETVDPS
jgi:hypothetical protein